ncbi:hypothetical protein HPB50_007856 [Hyalomma asiaticum]|uniref:Uncharacterized protein n=1 Tax=Hyalomma asiaticum TaxID=266040 RepID=A0ACB7T659_HYAAI|nr:hypothetical protein HPB50_007856 [Hyalomma asiaticum]
MSWFLLVSRALQTCGKLFQSATPRAFVWFAARPESGEETRASLSPRFPPCATEPSDESYVAHSATGEATTPGCLAATRFATRQRQRQPVGAEVQGCRLFDSLQRRRLQGRIKTQGAAADSRADPVSEETPTRSTCGTCHCQN